MLDGETIFGRPWKSKEDFFHKNVMGIFTKLTILKVSEIFHHPTIGGNTILFMPNPAASTCRVDIP